MKFNYIIITIFDTKFQIYNIYARNEKNGLLLHLYRILSKCFKYHNFKKKRMQLEFIYSLIFSLQHLNKKDLFRTLKKNNLIDQVLYSRDI